MSKVQVMDHPLIQHKLTILRDKNTGTKDFREAVNEIARLMAFEVSRDMPLQDVEIETPLVKSIQKELAGKKVAIIPILRAGLGMVEGMLKIIPTARVGHIGLYRDHDTKEPVEYYCKLPENADESEVIVLDPMLATGGSGSAAIQFIKDRGVKNIRWVCIIASSEGVERIHKDHPDVPIFCAAVDQELNENAYIVPGLGDAGDRIFGTK